MNVIKQNLAAKTAAILTVATAPAMVAGASLLGMEPTSSLLLAGIALGGFVGGAGWFVVDRTVLMPLRALKASIVDIGERGRQGQRLALHRQDEIGAVVDAINSMQGMLEEFKCRSSAISESTSDAVITFDANGMIITANSTAETMFGGDMKDLAGTAVTSLIPDLKGMLEASNPQKDVEAAAYRFDGASFPVEVNLSQFDLRGEKHHVVLVHDITGRKEQMAVMEHLAMHDALTGLPNRVLFFERLRTDLRYAVRNNEPISVIVVNIRRFKDINDTIGHAKGDQLIKGAASRLLELVRDTDTVARLGGDEFVLILPFANEDTATWVVRRIERSFEKRFTLGSQSYAMGVRCGIALSPDHGTDAGDLLRYADIASHAAPARTEGYAIYSPDLNTYSEDRLHLIGELRNAVATRQLRLHYQPKVDFKTRQVIGTEALVRWQHPEHGLLMPGQFVPDAEMYGMTRQMTGWVIEEAIAQRGRWLKDGIDLSISVNLSMQDLEDTEFTDWIAGVLSSRQSGPQGAGICLEVTETLMMAQPERVQRALEKLAAAGATISIDDFGTGYSSLTYLRQMPLSEVKVDRSFVMDMLGSAGSEAIVRAIVDLSHNLGLKVVAEGVSDEAIYNRLQEMGCDVAQGFFIAKPQPADALTQWLRSSHPWANRSKALRVVG
jgi:diguanylate cyclase (GGDEF)-like protein/PAS domain S-box-containing protein